MSAAPVAVAKDETGWLWDSLAVAAGPRFHFPLSDGVMLRPGTSCRWTSRCSSCEPLAPMVYVALLRGINLGGKNRIAMKDLCGWFEREGCLSVRHYIQSGNVVFETNAATAKTIGAKIANAIKRHLKLDVPVVVRTRTELALVVKNNPFLSRTSDGKALHVGFLSRRPTTDAIAALDPNRSPPDEHFVQSGEIYLHCPNGIGKSKLTTQWFDSKLETTSTFRNWNTVLRLEAMTNE